MSDDAESDDQWLYGECSELAHHENAPVEETEEENLPDTEDEPQTRSSKDASAHNLTFQPETPQEEPQEEDDDDAAAAADDADEQNVAGPEDGEIEKQAGDGSDKEDFDEDSDDDVNVVIGDIKTSSTYTSLNIKRGGLLTTTAPGDKSKQVQQPGKFTIEEFEQAGMINGVPATEFNLDSLEEKPWRKPGADITDYFNYGFNEDTWRAYCERQKRLRVNESGVGLAPMNSIGMPRGPVPIMNDNSKYVGNYAIPRKAGPPPARRMTGSIDVIGGSSSRLGTTLGKMEAPKENIIQVMTADRREYSRKPPGFPDMSMPPPNFEEFQPEYGFNPEPEPFYGGYEPTQDLQWGTEGNPNWVPPEIKPLAGPPMVPPVLNSMGGPAMVPSVVPMQTPPLKDGSPSRKDRDRDRDREISRSRSEKPRDKDRERSHRRERSRSRSRRHKSRSRSPSHRSHRKKKSRRHEESD